MTSATMSNLARKFDFLQDRAQRRPIREAPLEIPGDASKRTSIGHLKEFYLQRLAKNEPNAAARLGAQLSGSAAVDAAQPQASGQHVARPTFSASAVKDIEDLEIMCNNCFNLIKSSEASSCTGDPAECPLAMKNGGKSVMEKPQGMVGLLDLKLQKLRSALEARLQDSSSKVNVMRHLTQLRYHIDTAVKWVPGCSEIGALSDHTVLQVKQLTATSRVLAPAVYIFSKRIENVVVQKERELRKSMVQQLSASKGGGCEVSSMDGEHDELNDSVADVNSIVSELDSDCGTQYAETTVTQDGPANDVGNVQDANEYLSLKNEDEQRRWFYSQCLTVKLACPDKARARKTLISDLYAKVRGEGVPIEGWVQWIRSQLMPEEDGGGGDAAATNSSLAKTLPSGAAGSARRDDLEKTQPALGAENQRSVSGTVSFPLASETGSRPAGGFPYSGSALGAGRVAGRAGGLGAGSVSASRPGQTSAFMPPNRTSFARRPGA